MNGLRRIAGALALATTVVSCSSVNALTKLLLTGESRQLREREPGTAPSSPEAPPILFIAIDGVDRELLYSLVEKGKMPSLARLLGGADLAHAHLDRTLVATMPSTTLPAWATVVTGVGPAHHGVTGNEFFIRERRQFAAPAPVTFHDPSPTVESFSADEYATRLLAAPTVYEQMRERDPNISIWVSVHWFYRGADVLLMADRMVFAKAFETAIGETLEAVSEKGPSRKAYETLDEEAIEVVTDALEQKDVPVPDVLTIYLSGADLYGHVAKEGPDEARTTYLVEVLDPLFADLAEHLEARGALDGRWVVLTSDHGHTEVRKDDRHALAMKGEDDPPRVLEKAGFKVREFALETKEDADFSAVVAYQGATAYVYLADRSTCAAERPCDWVRPPRFQEDVLAVAKAFWDANATGAHVPGMKDTLDLVLAREPRPHAEVDAPFSVFDGERLVPIGTFLKTHPRAASYVDLEARLADLAVGPYGERAGDVLLLSRSAGFESPDERFYFAEPYRSWHGSPSKKDSEVPLIVANAKVGKAQIAARMAKAIGPRPKQQKVTDLLLSLRFE